MTPGLPRRAAAEVIGTGMLVAAVVGSGIMATDLTDPAAIQTPSFRTATLAISACPSGRSLTFSSTLGGGGKVTLLAINDAVGSQTETFPLAADQMSHAPLAPRFKQVGLPSPVRGRVSDGDVGGISQTRAWLSLPPVTKTRPSPETASDSTGPVCCSNRRMTSPVSTFHNQAAWSEDPVTTYRPSAEKTAAFSESRCPVNSSGCSTV